MRIEWNRKAEQQFYKIASTLNKEFGKKAVLVFVKNVNEWQSRIVINPAIAAFEPLLNNRKNAYRSIVIHKCCKLVYYVNQKQGVVRIAALWDTRQNPEGVGSSCLIA